VSFFLIDNLTLRQGPSLTAVPLPCEGWDVLTASGRFVTREIHRALLWRVRREFTGLQCPVKIYADSLSPFAARLGPRDPRHVPLSAHNKPSLVLSEDKKMRMTLSRLSAAGVGASPFWNSLSGR